MGFHKGGEEVHAIRLRHRGVSAFQNKFGSYLLLKQDGRELYKERTSGLMPEEDIKSVIDSIKDFDMGAV